MRRLPVIREERLIGIVTVFDVLKYVGYGKFHKMKDAFDVEKTLDERVENIMEDKAVTLHKEQDISDACNLIKKTGFGGFPVVEDDKLAGIITTSDIIEHIYGWK